jgi:hypothetical protein
VNPEVGQLPGSPSPDLTHPARWLPAWQTTHCGLHAKRTLGVVPLPIMAASSPPVVVRVISSGPGLMTLLVTFLVGAATALVVQVVIQFWVVPRVEKRKRREDRWERDVRELGELLTTSLTSLANEAHAAQLVFRDVRDEESDEYDPALVDRQARDAEQAMFAFGSLIGTQMDWLIGRVISPSPKADEIAHLQRVAGDYQKRAIFVRVLPEHDNRTDTAFHQDWDKEFTARKALIDQVILLADLRHPPRAPWLARRARRKKLKGPTKSGAASR